MRHPYFVYMAGPVAGIPYQHANRWREFVSKALPPHIQTISPMRGLRHFDNGQPMRNENSGSPLFSDRAVTVRSRFDILRSDAVLVNLLDLQLPSLDTMMELAWAYDHNIPIVAAIEPEGNAHDHPLFRGCITVRVLSLEEAIEAIVEIVSPTESMIWTRIEQVRLLQEENRLDLTQEPLKDTSATGYISH